MEKDGTYQKGRRKITQPVTIVPPEHVPDLVHEVQEAIQHLDRNRLILRRSTGGIFAAVAATLLAATAYLGSRFFTRELQAEHMRQELRDVDVRLEQMTRELQKTERRHVALETRVENLEERRR